MKHMLHTYTHTYMHAANILYNSIPDIYSLYTIAYYMYVGKLFNKFSEDMLCSDCQFSHILIWNDLFLWIF